MSFLFWFVKSLHLVLAVCLKKSFIGIYFCKRKIIFLIAHFRWLVVVCFYLLITWGWLLSGTHHCLRWSFLVKGCIVMPSSSRTHRALYCCCSHRHFYRLKEVWLSCLLENITSAWPWIEHACISYGSLEVLLWFWRVQSLDWTTPYNDNAVLSFHSQFLPSFICIVTFILLY